MNKFLYFILLCCIFFLNDLYKPECISHSTISFESTISQKYFGFFADSRPSVYLSKMVSVLKDKILEFHPDTLEYVRKDVNLEKESRMEEAVDILDDWVKKQQHFIKKDFSRDYLERTLINAKGMVERAKQRIDKLCTFKTLMPDLYPDAVLRKQFERLDNYILYALLPKMTKEHYRVIFLNVTSDDYQSSDIHNVHRYNTMVCEYVRINDYNNGLVIVLDFRNANIMYFLAKSTLMELRQVFTLMTEGYGMRIKQIHLLTASKMVDALISFLKQVLSSKLGGRIHSHKSIDTIYNFVPKDILPEEYGGKERSLQTLSDEWRERLTSIGFVEYFDETYQAKTDESCRQANNFIEQYAGMPGSFRALSVD